MMLGRRTGGCATARRTWRSMFYFTNRPRRMARSTAGVGSPTCRCTGAASRGDACRAQSLEDRAGDLQSLQEPGRSVRAQLRSRAAALGDGPGLAEAAGRSRGSSPTTRWSPIPPVVARLGDKRHTVGELAQLVSRSEVSLDGSLIPPHGNSLPPATGINPKLRIADISPVPYESA